MSNWNLSSGARFPRESLAGSVLQWLLVSGAAGMSVVIWLSALGPAQWSGARRAPALDPNHGFAARVTLPRVEVIGRRESLAGSPKTPAQAEVLSAGCAGELAC